MAFGKWSCGSVRGVTQQSTIGGRQLSGSSTHVPVSIDDSASTAAVVVVGVAHVQVVGKHNVDVLDVSH